MQEHTLLLVKSLSLFSSLSKLQLPESAIMAGSQFSGWNTLFLGILPWISCASISFNHAAGSDSVTPHFIAPVCVMSIFPSHHSNAKMERFQAAGVKNC